MKRLIYMLVLIAFTTVVATAQTTYQKNEKGELVQVKMPKSEAEVTKGATMTADVFVNSSGDKYPVWKNSNGRLFIVRKSKTDNHYRQYLEELSNK